MKLPVTEEKQAAPVIVPTVGRLLWFYNEASQIEPHAAIIAKVLPDHKVNLAVFHENGSAYARQSVPILSEGDERPLEGHFAEWMPYQKGQAAKTEALEKQLKA